MKNQKIVEWILRIGVAGEFIGHGVFAMQKKQEWIDWTVQLSPLSAGAAGDFIYWVGVVDIVLGIIVLVKPIRPLYLWMAFWGLWTALVRPLVDKPIWDFVERWANWAAPLALYFMFQPKKK